VNNARNLHRSLIAGVLALISLTGPAASVGFSGPLSMPARFTLVKGALAPRGGALRNLPLYFIENRGQIDGGVSFYVQGRETSVYFTRQGLRINSTTRTDSNVPSGACRQGARSGSLSLTHPAVTASTSSINLDFIGANPSVKIKAQNPTTAVVSYFKGPREHWKTAIPTWSSVTYEDLWPGIDLVYSGIDNGLKYSFIVRPDADPHSIRLVYRGATSVKLNDAGQIEVSTPTGNFHDGRPFSYQETNGKQDQVATSYDLNSSGGEYGFSVGPYDKNRPLIIDPTMVIYSGFIGGNGNDIGTAIALDSTGNAYVCGMTASLENTFPVAGGPGLIQRSPGSFDAFVAKVSADGSGLIYAGYIGGDQNDEALGIAVDSAGSAYVTGATTSSPGSFPLKGGPSLTYGGGILTGDAFVAKVDPTGTSLDYCGYIGGEGEDSGFGVAVDATGSAYVTGLTASTGPNGNGRFPAAVGPVLINNGGYDAFVAKIKPDGSGFVYAGFIGGAQDDGGTAIAVDHNGDAYVTGSTISTQATGFPVAVGPSRTQSGGSDAFVAKVKADGTGFVYCGFIGGSKNDGAYGIALDAGGNAYIAGNSLSTEATFPVKGGPGLTYRGGTVFGDAFVAKVKADGSSLVYCGYIGGAGEDAATAIAVDSAGNAYVTGSTTSAEDTFPVNAGPQLIYKGGITYGDAFVAKVNAAGTTLVYCGYLGGTADDAGLGIAVDAAGSAYVVGSTFSTEFSNFPLAVGPATKHGGGMDAFITKIAFTTPGPAPTLTSIKPGSGPATGGTAVTLTGSNFVAGATVSIGGAAASGISVVSAKQITAVTGAGVAGLADVAVANPDGQVARLTGKFTYTVPPPPPTITGATAGPKNLVVTGTGFDHGAVITINGQGQVTKNDPASPTTSLIGVKIIKKKIIAPGQTVTLQVRDASGAVSNQFSYKRPSL
jgi:hypothetical protein